MRQTIEPEEKRQRGARRTDGTKEEEQRKQYESNVRTPDRWRDKTDEREGCKHRASGQASARGQDESR